MVVRGMNHIQINWGVIGLVLAGGLSLVVEDIPNLVGWLAIIACIVYLIWAYRGIIFGIEVNRLNVFIVPRNNLTTNYSNHYIDNTKHHNQNENVVHIGITNCGKNVARNVKVSMTRNTVAGSINPSPLLCMIGGSLKSLCDIRPNSTAKFDFVYDLPSALHFHENLLCGICTKQNQSLYKSKIDDFVRVEISIDSDGICLAKEYFKITSDTDRKIQVEHLKNWTK